MTFLTFMLLLMFPRVLNAFPPDLLVDVTLNVEDAFSRYFQSGATYKIIQNLMVYHGVFLSVNALKQKRRRLGLQNRQGNPSNTVQEVADAIEQLLPTLPWTAGYRNVHQTLKHMGYDVRRDCVMNIMRDLDPRGVQLRQRRRLKRRRYICPGPDFNWHVDGYDKLKPYGFAIHGAIDGFSRRIMWLEVNPSNNNPSFVATNYMMCVEQRNGCPHLLCTDPGTENSIMAALQSTFRANDLDEYSGVNSHRYVKSTSNQRIEAWWCLFRRDRMEWWITFFTRLSASPEFNKDNDIHKYCLRYCFMPVLKRELREIAARWNIHYNSGNPAGKCPHGRPDLLYSLNESFLHNLTDKSIQEGYTECKDQTRSGNVEFDEYAHQTFEEMNWIDAETSETAYEQYIELRNFAEN